MLNSNRCGFNQLELSGLSGSPSVSSFSSGECLQVSVAMLYYSTVMVSIGSLSTWSPSVSSFSSGECGNAILQYCYGSIGSSTGS